MLDGRVRIGGGVRLEMIWRSASYPKTLQKRNRCCLLLPWKRFVGHISPNVIAMGEVDALRHGTKWNDAVRQFGRATEGSEPPIPLLGAVAHPLPTCQEKKFARG